VTCEGRQGIWPNYVLGQKPDVEGRQKITTELCVRKGSVAA